MTCVNKTKHKYNDELEATLIHMDSDQFLVWLETNEIEYEIKNLIDLILIDATIGFNNQTR